MTLPVAFISVFLGRAFGSGSRWVMGYDDQRAKGTKIVEGLLSIGITPSRIVRTDLDTTKEPLATWAVTENSRGHLTQMPADLGDMGVTVTKRPTRTTTATTRRGATRASAYEIIAMDPGQELTGTLLEMWNNLRLRGISRWVVPLAQGTGGTFLLHDAAGVACGRVHAGADRHRRRRGLDHHRHGGAAPDNAADRTRADALADAPRPRVGAAGRRAHARHHAPRPHPRLGRRRRVGGRCGCSTGSPARWRPPISTGRSTSRRCSS